jgi:hypothetical protein
MLFVVSFTGAAVGSALMRTALILTLLPRLHSRKTPLPMILLIRCSDDQSHRGTRAALLRPENGGMFYRTGLSENKPDRHRDTTHMPMGLPGLKPTDPCR